MKKQGAFQITFFIIMIISTITIIFLGTEYLFHSDDATAILVAREQILNKSILSLETELTCFAMIIIIYPNEAIGSLSDSEKNK